MMGRGDSAAAAEQQASSAAPLLEKTSSAAAAAEASEEGGGGAYYYVDGCPGCAVDRYKAARPGIPYANFIYVWVVTLCTGNRHAMPFPSAVPSPPKGRIGSVLPL